MTTETSNAAGHTCSYACERPECIRAQRDELASRLTAPPPAAARGDVRGLVAKWRAEADEIAANNWACNSNSIRARADELEAALAAEGVQAGEVEQRGVPEYTSAPTYGPKDMQAAWRSGYNTHAMGGRVGGIDAPEAYSFDAELVADMLSNYQRRVATESGESARTRVIQQQVDALRAIVAALSQQPEARGVVDEAIKAALAELDALRGAMFKTYAAAANGADKSKLLRLIEAERDAYENHYSQPLLQATLTGERNG